MRNVFIQPVPETLEEHLWCLDGQYLWGYHDGRRVVGMVRFGVREDDSWGPVWMESIQRMTISYEPIFAEALFRCQIGVNEALSRAQNRAVYTDGAWMHLNVKAVRQIVLDDNEVVGMLGVEAEFKILDPGQVQQFAAIFRELDEDETRNPYEIAWGQVPGINGQLGWAQRLQAHRIAEERGQWELPEGMYELLTEEGDVLLLYLGYEPEAGSTVTTETRPHMLDFLLEEVEGGTRLAQINENLPFSLVVKGYGDSQR